MNGDIEITLLSREEVFGKVGEEKLEILEKYGIESALTDLAFLTGGSNFENVQLPNDPSLKGRAGNFYTSSMSREVLSSGSTEAICAVSDTGYEGFVLVLSRTASIRPVLYFSEPINQVAIEEVELGEYPQYAPDKNMQKTLDEEFQKETLKSTGRNYTFDKMRYDAYSEKFQPITYDEYEYMRKRYIRVKANLSSHRVKLSNGECYRNGDYVWVEVSPVVWLIDFKSGKLISKRLLLSGIVFTHGLYNGDFSTTEIKKYLDHYMLRDLTQARVTKEEEISHEEQKRRNPYGLNFNQVSEETL